MAKPKSRRNVPSSKLYKEVNGVDISDLSRWYDSSEMKKLNESQAGKRILANIMDDKKRNQRHKDKIDKIKSEKHRRVKSIQVTPAEDSSTLSDRDWNIVAVELDSGETITLEFGQGLWFGDRMQHSLPLLGHKFVR